MSFLPYPPANATEAIAVFQQDIQIAHDIIHGDNTQQVDTEGGIVPTFAKVIKTLTDEVEAATGVDTSLRSNLANVNSTVSIAGFQARQIRYIESIKDLVPVDGVLMSVKGFFSGYTTGGGEFYYDASVPKTSHNGGTIIDPVRLAAWDGTKANVATLFVAGSSGTGCFVRIYEGKVQPQFWGAMCGDSAVTDTPSLKKFVDFVDLEQNGFNMQGSPLLSETLKFKNIGSFKTFIMDVQVRITASFSNQDIFEFNGQMHGCKHIGNINMSFGQQTFHLRKVRHGIVLNPASAGYTSRVDWDVITANQIKGWAVYNAVNNGYVMNFNRITAGDCGACPSGGVQSKLLEVSNPRNKTGSSGATNQTTTITVSGSNWTALDIVLPASLIKVDDANPFNTEVFEIDSIIDANNIVIKPWFDPVSGSPSQMQLCQGGALYQLGGDTSRTRIGTLDAITCGYGIRDNVLYGATVQNLMTQYCGVGAQIGGYFTAQIGAAYLSCYFENNKVDVLHAASPDQSDGQSYVGSPIALNRDKVKPFRVKHASVGDYWYYPFLRTTIDWSTKTYKPTQGSTVESVFQPTTLDITIDSFLSYYTDPAVRSIKIIGSNTGGGPISSVTIPVPSGCTINGGSSPVVISATANPVTITVVRYKNEFYNKGRFTNDYLVRIG